MRSFVCEELCYFLYLASIVSLFMRDPLFVIAKLLGHNKLLLQLILEDLVTWK